MTSHRIMNVACHFVSLGCCLTVVLFGSLVGAAPPPMQVSSYGSSQPVVNQITGTAVAMHHATTDRLLPRKTAAQLNPCVPGLGPAAPHPIWGVDSTSAMGPCGKRGEPGWDSRAMIDWQQYAQGEYVGNARTAHVPSYRLRVDDSLAIYFLRTRQVLARPYELQVGDRIRVESLTAGSSTPLSGDNAQQSTSEDSLNREVVIQPDGMITLPLVGRVPSAGRQVEALQGDSRRTIQSVLQRPCDNRYPRPSEHTLGRLA